MPEPDYLIRQGNFGESITAVLLNESLQVIDLTDATVIFVMALIQERTPTVDALATIDDAGMGAVSYTFASGDTDVAGLYLAEFRVTYIGGAVQSFPNGGYKLVRVTSKLDV